MGAGLSCHGAGHRRGGDAGHRAAGQHFPTQGRGAQSLSQAGERHREYDRPRALGHELAARVRPVQAHLRSIAYHLRRRRRSGFAGESGTRPVARPHVRRLRLLAGLPRPARARLHAPRPGKDPPRHRAPRAGLLPALPCLDHPHLPPGGRRGRDEGLREGLRDDVPRRARAGGQDRLGKSGARPHGPGFPAR